MRLTTSAVFASIPLLFLSRANAQDIYTKNSPVLQVSAKDYDRLIAKSNHTSIVEFYAPWCGHCKNLKPAYEKAATSLKGLAKVAAINCDDESNKSFCGSMGVRGFPTLKIVKPGQRSGKPVVEDYQGQRSAKAIVDAVVDKIPNHVKRVDDNLLDAWLKENSDRPKALLFTEKGTTSALFRALAVDFLGGIDFAQVRNTQKQAVARFGISSFPALLLLEGAEKEPLLYSGEMKKDAMLAFLSKVTPPNPDPPPMQPKPSRGSKSEASKKLKDSSSFRAASASHASSEATSLKASATSETVEEPTASPDPNLVDEKTPRPVKVPDVAPMIPELDDQRSLEQACLTPTSKTCILAFVPAEETQSQSAANALLSLSEIAQKHALRQAHLFPFYSLTSSNPGSSRLRGFLGLQGDDVVIIAVNAKKRWWRKYNTGTFAKEAVENWIDAIRMGEGAKDPLPESAIVPAQNAEKPKGADEPIQIKIDNLEDLLNDERIQFELEEIEDDPEHDEL